jgi:hypothetical protein
MDRSPQFGWLVICYRLGAFIYLLILSVILLIFVASRFVALKITAGDIPEGSQEARILKLLAENSASDVDGSQHIIRLLDYFQIEGPNGTHDVLVTEVLISLDTLMRYPVYEKARNWI